MSSSGFLARALEGLAHLGLIEHHEGGFVLTEDGRLMLPGAIGGFGDMASLWHDLFDGAWAEFETTMRIGGQALPFVMVKRSSRGLVAMPSRHNNLWGRCAVFRS